MGVELRPLGVACNITCTYCYQDPQRHSGNVRQEYDLQKMKAAVERAGGPFTLFGGEPLLIPLADLEDLWRWGLARYGENAIQTNGVLINEEHLRMFREYRVRVGVSIDGPGALNDARRNGSQDKTRSTTAQVEATIERLCELGSPPGLIVTLHRGNAIARCLPVLQDWVRRMDRLGIRSMRLHLLEVDAPEVRSTLALSNAENLVAMSSLMALQPELKTLRLDVNGELSALLRGKDKAASCVWRACDPYTTAAVRGVEGNGQSSNCGRTNKDGIDFIKAAESGYERYIALYHTPQEHGGCQGCRFFLMCKGHCPGTAIDGDWRNRTEHCETWKALFTRTEEELSLAGGTPLSLDPARPAVEAHMLAAWADGKNPDLQDLPRDTPSATFARLPRFARLSWVSEAARALWQPRVERWSAIRGRLAVLHVARGLVTCAVTRAAPEQIYVLTLEASMHGLQVEVLGEPPLHHQYTPTAACHRTGVWLLIGKEPAVAGYHRLRSSGQILGIANLLGVPSCCASFSEQLRDTDEPVWRRAQNSAQGDGASIEIEGSPHSHGLLSRLGVATIQHQTCTFGCPPSEVLGEALLTLARQEGYEAEAAHVQELLSLAVSWSALHGISEIKTPLFKLATEAQPTPWKHAIQYHGKTQIAFGGVGLNAPFGPPPQRSHLRVARNKPAAIADPEEFMNFS